MEDEYNKRFKDNELSNDGFDAAGLWDNIAEELDTPEPKAATTFPWKTLGIGLLVLFASLGVFYTFSDFSEQEEAMIGQEENLENERYNSLSKKDEVAEISNKNRENAEEEASLKNAFIPPNNVNEQEFPQVEKELVKSKEVIMAEIANINDTSSDLEETKTNTFDLNNVANPKTDSSGDSGSPDESDLDLTDLQPYHNQKNTSSNASQRNKKITNNETKNSNFSKNSSENKIDLKTDLLPENLQFLQENLPILSDSLLLVGLLKTKADWDKKIEEAKKKERKIAFTTGLYGGVNRTSFQYESTTDADFAQQRNTTENAVSGTTYGLDAAILYKGWRVNTGVELQNIWTKLNTEFQTDTSVFQTQVLSLVRIDGMTGNTLSTLSQDTTVNATELRTIVHHNQFQVLSFPLEIGHYRTHKKWSYGISAGTSLNILRNQSGRILNNDNTILDFDKNSDQIGFQEVSMSLRAHLFVGYQLTEHLLLHLSPQWSRSVQNIQNNAMQAKVQQVHFTLGLRSVF